MSAPAKRKLVLVDTNCTEQYELHTDDVDETKVLTKTRKRPLSKVEPSSSSESSSSSIKHRLRSDKSEPKEDEGVKPIYPPPINLTVNQDARAIAPCSFNELRKKLYFVDKTDLIREIYKDESPAKFYCFPRAGTKSTVVSALVEWLVNDDKRRAERLECFKGLKIMDFFEKENDDIGFNQHVIVGADFGCVETENRTLDEIETGVTKEFCRYLRKLYSLGSEAMTVIESLKPDHAYFFLKIIDRVQEVLPPTTPKRPALLIIDNFDAPALRLLKQTESTELARDVMSFFDWMLNDVRRLENKLFDKVILFGTHLPISFKTNSLLRKIPVESYPYGRKEICSNFFFSTEEVKTLLKKYGEDETKVTELAQICGQYNIEEDEYFHPGCIVNYLTRQRTKKIGVENPVYWTSLDSLDVLPDTSSMLRYEMILWTYPNNQILHFKYQNVLDYEKLIKGDRDTAFTYLLEAGYLTRKRDTDVEAGVYQIVNVEARNLFRNRYKQWCERIPETDY